MQKDYRVVNVTMPTYLKERLQARRKEIGKAEADELVCRALEAVLNEDAIPFTDEYDDESKWATKEDVQALLEHISDTKVTLGDRLDKLGVLANTLEHTLASINGLVVKP